MGTNWTSQLDGSWDDRNPHGLNLGIWGVLHGLDPVSPGQSGYYDPTDTITIATIVSPQDETCLPFASLTINVGASLDGFAGGGDSGPGAYTYTTCTVNGVLGVVGSNSPVLFAATGNLTVGVAGSVNLCSDDYDIGTSDLTGNVNIAGTLTSDDGILATVMLDATSGTPTLTATGTLPNCPFVISSLVSYRLTGNVNTALTLSTGGIIVNGTRAIGGNFAQSNGTLSFAATDQLNVTGTATWTGGTLTITGTGTAGSYDLVTTTGGITGTPTLGTVPAGFTGSLAITNSGNNLTLTLTSTAPSGGGPARVPSVPSVPNVGV